MTSEIYGEAHRAMQAGFGTQPLADRLRDVIVVPEIPEDHRAFIESREFFFLSSIDHRGFPTCSHKGGPRGFVRVIDPQTLAFPSYDGNGMYLSMGNIAARARVGMLFMDFETPHRVRVHGTASVLSDDPLLAEYPEAELIVRVKVSESFVNCPRYITRQQRVAPSPYVPHAGCQTPQPAWKRIDGLQDVISDRDRAAIQASGDSVISFDEYAEKLGRGEA